MAIVGCLLGLLVAVMLHFLMETLRRRWPTPIAVLGWLLAVVVVVYGALLMNAYLAMRNDPRTAVGPLWGFLALMLGLLLLLCAGIGNLHRRRYGITWLQAFGVLMVEAGAAIATGFLFNEFRYSIADFIRGENENIGRILDSYARVGVLFNYLDLTLLVSLLLLSTFVGRWAGRARFSGRHAA